MEQMEEENSMNKKLAVVVPYRDREAHLNVFMPYMDYALKGIDYKMIIVNQVDDKLFNRGKLFNVGFAENLNFDYYCFHDVDALPINFRGLYDYCDVPHNLVGRYLDKDWGPLYYGGVSLFSKESFENINGFSNDFYGWGAEDDDLLKRVTSKDYPLKKRGGLFLSLEHTHIGRTGNPNYQSNFDKLHSGYDFSQDGLSNLDYEVNKVSNLSENVTMMEVSL